MVFVVIYATGATLIGRDDESAETEEVAEAEEAQTETQPSG